MWRWLWLTAAVAALACGGGRRGGSGLGVDGGTTADAGTPRDGDVPRDGGPMGADGGPLPTDDGGGGLDGGTATTDAGGTDAGMPIALCRIGCTTSADCDSGSPAFDADNYTCRARVCVYDGCNDDAECRATFASSDYGCATVGGSRLCLERCASATDCGTGTPAFDGDNFRCVSGTCRYDGCRSDTECTGTFGAGYVCATVLPPDTGLPIPTAARNCVLGCSSRADCTTGSAAFDADNYECLSGSCRYTGCNDDAECRASFSSSRYVCG